MALPERATEIDPDAEAVKRTISRNLTVADEIHAVRAKDGHGVYARIVVTASESHPLPLELLASLTDGLRESWLDGRERAGE